MIIYQRYWSVKYFTKIFGKTLNMNSIRFAENLRSLRQSKKMTQSELGKMLGVDKRTVSAWENKVCEPSFTMLARLCDIFDESFDNILT